MDVDLDADVDGDHDYHGDPFTTDAIFSESRAAGEQDLLSRRIAKLIASRTAPAEHYLRPRPNDIIPDCPGSSALYQHQPRRRSQIHPSWRPRFTDDTESLTSSFRPSSSIITNSLSRSRSVSQALASQSRPGIRCDESPHFKSTLSLRTTQQQLSLLHPDQPRLDSSTSGIVTHWGFILL
ncbi:hypothetical protein EJ05DRAFT_67177 [Pseudovirgaria hyperparasitica]|uniref:Uncharacterized protein n=1 Tax=Pseudovirgaria hyperparasitica TaxID=470096 RepID=A0A6A6W3E2_9PEZI|nr:uncharacterized protein EJ05DRAFT_67177 [Pseudovirgaria hyperparasitica]KAF2756534.1 hypothetical protein EJ05DRAFT_67177 [Pseudovirgaria hyperparasitica]